MERLNKYIARTGVVSRRQADQLIESRRVSVNGIIVETMGTKIDPAKDRVMIDGKLIDTAKEFEYLILHKPQGYLTTVRDPFGRQTVMRLLPQDKCHLYPVGRLDLNTTGLLFFTNDGDLALALTHPRHLIEKRYLVTVKGIPSIDKIKQLSEGILLEDGKTAPAKVRLENIENGNATLEVIIREGRKRQIKRMMKAIGHPVLSLHRQSFGPLNLGKLKPGEYRGLTQSELEQLLKIKQIIMNKH